MQPHILIVDDEYSTVALLTLLLEGGGYRVSRAYDGATTLTSIAADRPDLLLIDNVLPDLRGTEVIDRLRLESAQPWLPAILMSAVPPPTVPPDTIFLPKPFDVDRVLALIAELLGRAA